MARHLICIIHGVGKHDSNKRRERLDEMVKNKDLLLPRVPHVTLPVSVRLLLLQVIIHIYMFFIYVFLM